MLRIRFLRVGKKNSPSFRIVVTPRRSAAKTGRFLEVLGFYNPIRHERGLKRERIQHWLSQGAQPSDSMRNMLVAEGIMEGKKTPVHKKSKKKEEEIVAEAPKAETKTDSIEVPASSEGGEAPEKAAEEGGESTTPASEPVVEEAEKKEDSPGESEETAAVEDKKV